MGYVVSVPHYENAAKVRESAGRLRQAFHAEPRGCSQRRTVPNKRRYNGTKCRHSYNRCGKSPSFMILTVASHTHSIGGGVENASPIMVLPSRSLGVASLRAKHVKVRK